MPRGPAGRRRRGRGVRPDSLVVRAAGSRRAVERGLRRPAANLAAGRRPAAEPLARWRADAVQEEERARLERPADPRARLERHLVVDAAERTSPGRRARSAGSARAANSARRACTWSRTRSDRSGRPSGPSPSRTTRPSTRSTVRRRGRSCAAGSRSRSRRPDATTGTARRARPCPGPSRTGPAWPRPSTASTSP